MIKNLEFNSLCNEVSGDFCGTQFTMSVKVIGDYEPELYFSDEQYYNHDGDPKLLQPQFALTLKDALAETIYETEEYQTMLREYRISEHDYRDYLNDY